MSLTQDVRTPRQLNSLKGAKTKTATARFPVRSAD
jgi:hypothetical protein